MQVFFCGAGGILATQAPGAITNPLVGFSSLAFVVELEGFEPSSKRGTNMLSTCLVATWFL